MGASCFLPEGVFPSTLGEKRERWPPKGPPSTQESGPSCVRLCPEPGICSTPQPAEERVLRGKAFQIKKASGPPLPSSL